MSAGTIDKPAMDHKPSELTPYQKTKSWLQSEDFKNAIAQTMPKHMTADRFVRIALTSMMRVPKLAQCTQESIFNCLLQLSQYGLEPDGRNAHLIPFDVKKKQGGQWTVDHTDCTLIVDFKGYVELVMRSGLVANIHADVVCEHDEFEYDRGCITKHKIDFRHPRGKAYAAYAVVRFKDGTEKTEVMPAEDILAIRDRSQGWKAFKAGYAHQSPWNPAEPVIEREMWKKTVFRRATKWVQLSPEIRETMAKEDDSEERIRLLAATNAPPLIETTATKTESLIEEMRQRQMVADEQQQAADDNGEESQDRPEDQTQEPKQPTDDKKTDDKNTEAEIAKKIKHQIDIAADLERLSHLGGEADLLTDPALRAELSERIAARTQQLDAMSGKAEPTKKSTAGKLPGVK